MSRQPTAGGDNGTWGPILNDYLSVSLNADGTIKPAAITAGGGFSASLIDAKGDVLVGTANDTIARKAVGANGSALNADSATSDGLGWYFNPLWFPTYKAASYYFCNSPAGTATNATLGNNTWRGSMWIATRAVSITRIGAEFTVAGDAASIFRIGIYADDGTGVPTGAAVLDAGSISTGTGNAGTVATGGTPGVYEITVSTTINPGLYWVGGAVQGVTVTQPTMRTVSNTSIVQTTPLAAIPAINSNNIGYQLSGVSGALPTWSGNSGSGAATRIFFKTA